jgi:hypothetical protein
MQGWNGSGCCEAPKVTRLSIIREGASSLEEGADRTTIARLSRALSVKPDAPDPINPYASCALGHSGCEPVR